MQIIAQQPIYKLQPLNNVSWQKQVQMGYYMKGAIKAAKGALCARCGHSSFTTVEDDFLNYKVPKCNQCQGPPSKLRVTKNIPSIGRENSSVKNDYYRDLDGNLLTKISHALALIGKINDDLKDGTFKPETYDVKSKQRLEFSNYAKEYIEICNNRLTYPNGHDFYLSPGAHKEKKRLINDELAVYFKKTLITKIDKFQIQQFNRSYVTKFRTRDLAMGELKTMLRFAFNELGLIEKIPAFPKIPKARKRKSYEVPSKEMQIKIINAIDDTTYRAMAIVESVLIKRPGETRAYKVKDVCLTQKEIQTRRHFSKGENGEVLIDGRKSIGLDDELGSMLNKLDKRLIEILTPFVIGRDPEDFLFPGKVNAHVSGMAYWEAIKRACKKLKVNYSPYAVTKSASLTDHVKQGGSMESAQAMAGHKNSQQTETYVKISAIDTVGMIDSSVFEWGSQGVLKKDSACKVINFKR
jgi:integrase